MTWPQTWPCWCQDVSMPYIQVWGNLVQNLVSHHAQWTHTHTMTHTQPFNGLWSGTTRVGRYQKKHSPTHTYPDHRSSFIIFLHLQLSVASSLFILHAWQSSRTTSVQVLFGLLLGLGPSTSYFIMHSELIALYLYNPGLAAPCPANLNRRLRTLLLHCYWLTCHVTCRCHDDDAAL